MKLRETLEQHPFSTAFILGVTLSGTAIAAAGLTRHVIIHAPRQVRLERSIQSLSFQLERMHQQAAANVAKHARAMDLLQRRLDSMEKTLEARSKEEINDLAPVPWKGQPFKAAMPKATSSPSSQSYGLHAGIGKFGPMPIVDPQNPNYITFGK